jgi:hypothetical protein
MAEHEKIEINEKPGLEEHLVYALRAIPIFLVTIFIVFLIATFGTR